MSLFWRWVGGRYFSHNHSDKKEYGATITAQ